MAAMYAPELCGSLSARVKGALSSVHPEAAHGPSCVIGSATQQQHRGWLGGEPVLLSQLTSCSLPSRGVAATSVRSSTDGVACAVATTSSSPGKVSFNSFKVTYPAVFTGRLELTHDKTYFTTEKPKGRYTFKFA
jgi:hypothetical protein